MKQIEASDAAVKKEFTELDKKRTVFDPVSVDKKTGEIVATTPKEALNALNKGYGLNLSQDILNDYFELMDSLKKNLPKEKVNQILDTFIKILDSTRADIPIDIQDYWIANQDRLGLKGKFLPDNSNLIKYKTA
jgi:hypothetical protein